MATQKPTSTISYNSVSFLIEKLETWVSSHIIQAYMFIEHKGEDGDKDHIHLRIEPNKKLDTMDLTESLREFVPGNDKPLCVRPWRPSKEEDWILYVLHDPEYLKLKYGGGDKGEKLPYDWRDIVASYGFDVEMAYIRAKAALKHNSVNMAARMQQGESALSMIMQGENVYLVNAVLKALQNNDYSRISKELIDLTVKYGKITDAIDRAGLVLVVSDENTLELWRQSDEQILEPYDGGDFDDCAKHR